MSVKVKAFRVSCTAIRCKVFIRELSESEPIEEVSKTTFTKSKSTSIAAQRDKLIIAN